MGGGISKSFPVMGLFNCEMKWCFTRVSMDLRVRNGGKDDSSPDFRPESFDCDGIGRMVCDRECPHYGALPV